MLINIIGYGREMRLPSVNVSMRIAAILALLTYFIAFLNDRILSADGAYYLARLADWHGFVLVGWHRSNAQFATQWLPVYGSRLFDLSLEELKGLYSLNVYLVAVVSFLLCSAWMRSAPTLLALPLLSFVLLEFNSTFIIMGEHHVLALAVWPILAFCLFPSTRWYDWGLFLGLCLLATRSYEAGAIVLALPFLLCLWNAWAYRASHQRWLWVLAGIILAIGIVISIDGIIHPRDVSNYMGFREQVLVALGSPLAQVALAMSIATVAGLYFGQARYLLLGVVASIGIILGQQMTFHKVTALQSFSARTFTVSVLPFLLAIAIAYGKLGIGRDFSRKSAAVFLMFMGVACFYSLITEWRWHKVTTRIEQTLKSHSGFVPVSETGLSMDEFVGTFTIPTMSVFMSGRCVSSILQLPEGYWLPYDLVKDNVLSRYRQYDRTVNGQGCSG
ncbi:hypothetical protein [Rhizobium oryzicola]|uniref:Glycosyltransferase RgtA/B/C/D-like domain-containing protein n=1 Tax=Rhizobium oryzicola TaxID=1232668 RepID=A0ABT8T155_9HYPH|nr:hypothetical protein [Rhizobium oryzicola]MDO1584367.1 hypothetical protein [Rhizobium oryzicola]